MLFLEAEGFPQEFVLLQLALITIRNNLPSYKEADELKTSILWAHGLVEKPFCEPGSDRYHSGPFGLPYRTPLLKWPYSMFETESLLIPGILFTIQSNDQLIFIPFDVQGTLRAIVTINPNTDTTSMASRTYLPRYLH